MRLTVGDLDPSTAVPIGDGEHAHIGDIVASRRNHRRLCTERGEPVRNRDLWTVVATHGDGAVTVSHLGGHGSVTLPADYTREHVRLGYAATEHGHQGDTVDISIALVSRATTHRGLYVGVTRGRDENRIHVITDTDDIAEARDVLDAVLAHDRADIPAVTQRRHLAHQTNRPEPVREPEQVVPGWLTHYRDRLEQRRDDLTAGLTERAHRRIEAAAELADLQPALDAAREASQPYADRINAVEDELAIVLRPAMWQANHDACRAGFGQRHGAARRAKIATWRVDDAQDRIAAIRADGAHIKDQLDAVEADARRLAELASPSTGHFGIDQLDCDQLHALDQTAEAIDTWTTWANGRPVPTPSWPTRCPSCTTSPSTRHGSRPAPARSTGRAGSSFSNPSTPWVVLTDGREWRIYNAHAPVPIEDKLLRTVRVDGDLDEAADVLALLSKDNLRDQRLDEMWKVQFVDRQMRDALTELFSGSEPSRELVAFVHKRLPQLARADVRASLVRARATFDFPAVSLPAPPHSQPPPPAAPAASALAATRIRSRAGAGKSADKVTAAERATTLADVVAAGAIADNTIRASYDGTTHTATVDTAGNVTYQQTTYRSLSAAGEAMKVALRGPNIPESVKATDGWSFWSATDATGETVKLRQLRRRVATQHQPEGDATRR